ncbi:MAG TPA: ABC transporter permease subunit [Methanocellaceae archaeon]
MLFGVLKQSIKSYMKSGIVVALLVFALLFYIGDFSTALSSSLSTSAADQLASNPLVKALVGNVNLDLNSFEGYMAFKGLSMMGLIVSIYLAFLASSSIAGEIEHNTMDMLLSLPAKRTEVIISRSLALIPVIVLIGIAQILAIYLSAIFIHHSVDMIWFVYVVLSISMLELAAGSLAILLSAFLSNGKTAVLASILIYFIMYMVETIGSMVSSISPLRTISLFHYQEISGILAYHTVTWNYMAVLLVVAVVLMALATFVFQQRDINIS